MRIHDETVIEGEIRIVKNARAPLLSRSLQNVIVVNGNNNREVLSRRNRYVAIGDESDVRLGMTLDLLHVTVLIPTVICTVHMEHNTILFHGRKRSG